MKINSLQILIACFDSQISQEIASKLKDRYKQVSFEFDFHPEGTRALSDFKIKKHSLLIITSELPGLNGERLIQEIFRNTGSASILLLGNQITDVLGCEFIKLPILNWTDFFNKLQNVVSEDVRTTLGIQNQDSILVDQLLKYGEKYKEQTLEQTPGFHTLPVRLKSEKTQGSLPSPTVESQPHKIENLDATSPVDEKQLKHFWIMDWALLLILLISNIVLFYKNDGSEWSWISIRGLLFILTITSLITLLASRRFDLKFLRLKK
jgi:hypothetical protein